MLAFASMTKLARPAEPTGAVAAQATIHLTIHLRTAWAGLCWAHWTLVLWRLANCGGRVGALEPV